MNSPEYHVVATIHIEPFTVPGGPPNLERAYRIKKDLESWLARHRKDMAEAYGALNDTIISVDLERQPNNDEE